MKHSNLAVIVKNPADGKFYFGKIICITVFNYYTNSEQMQFHCSMVCILVYNYWIKLLKVQA